MSLVRFQSVNKHYGAHDVLNGLTFVLNPGTKAGLIGSNGAGKTTALRLILGTEEPSSGAVIRGDGIQIGYVPQYPEFPEGCTVMEALTLQLREVERELRSAEEKLSVVDQERLEKALKQYQAARDAYDAMDGDGAKERAEKLLSSFGLAEKKDQKVETLSGGEGNILSLAQATLTRPDMLVLDEPGNHLDYLGLAWLEEFLISYPGAVLLVSHNRYLLDRVVEVILELEDGSITEYKGNYSEYRRTKLQKLVSAQSDYVANQKRLAQLEELVKRFEQITRATSDPKWGKRLRARRTQLAKERERAVEKPELDTKAMQVGLSGRQTKADIALQINGYNKSFGDNQLFDSADLQFPCGGRVALVGPNGSGKTTLLKDIISNGSWDDTVLRVGPSLVVGYCAQDQDVFDPSKTILETFVDLGTQNRKITYSLLSSFLFSWNDLDKKVSGLSGGELNRLQLARLKVTEASFLILDEPTNHLDIGSREAIEEALEEFNGTLLVVSHDRYFLDKIADTIVEIRDKKLEPFSGNFSEFWQSCIHNKRPANRVRNLSNLRKNEGRMGHGSGSGEAAVSKGLEERIERLEAEREILEQEITRAFEHGDHVSGRAKSNKLEQLSSRIEKLYEEAIR